MTRLLIKGARFDIIANTGVHKENAFAFLLLARSNIADALINTRDKKDTSQSAFIGWQSPFHGAACKSSSRLKPARISIK